MSKVPPKILMVISDKADILALNAMIKNIRVDLIFTDNGITALNYCRTQYFTMVIIDSEISKPSFIETADSIHRAYKDQPPLMFAADFGNSHSKSFNQAGFSHIQHLYQPLTPNVVRAKVLDFLKLTESGEALALPQSDPLTSPKNQSKWDFVSMMSHEIRTPISGIVGGVELLKNTKLTEEQKKILGIVDSSSIDMVNSLDKLPNAGSRWSFHRQGNSKKPFIRSHPNFNLYGQRPHPQVTNRTR